MSDHVHTVADLLAHCEKTLSEFLSKLLGEYIRLFPIFNEHIDA